MVKYILCLEDSEFSTNKVIKENFYIIHYESSGWFYIVHDLNYNFVGIYSKIKFKKLTPAELRDYRINEIFE